MHTKKDVYYGYKNPFTSVDGFQQVAKLRHYTFPNYVDYSVGNKKDVEYPNSMYHNVSMYVCTKRDVKVIYSYLHGFRKSLNILLSADRRTKRIATELQSMFPQFSLEVIMSVVQSETTSDASARKLIEMEEERSKELALQYEENLKHHEVIKQNQRLKGVEKYKRDSLEGESEIPPPEEFKTSTPKAEPELGTDIIADTNDFLAELDKRTGSGSLSKQRDSQPLPPASQGSGTPAVTQRAELPAVSVITVKDDRAKVVAESPDADKTKASKDKKADLAVAPSYSDLASPALDLLLRGFGGREKHAPEKTSDLSLPAHVVEAHLKGDITTNNTPPTPTTPNNQDLAARKEARRRARRERRERQQREREEAAKLGQKVEHRGSRREKNHITNHSNKERLAVSQSTPALNKHIKSPAQHVDDDLTRNGKAVVRQGASSGYDTGTELGQDNQAQSGAHFEPQSLEQASKQPEKKAPVKYVCGPKYDSVHSKSGSNKSKPARYESRKAKRYSSRRKTLNYDHYSTDRQDRTSL